MLNYVAANLKLTDLNANDNKIINVADPSDDGDVINKRYLESNFLKKDGSNDAEGDLNMNTNKIINVANPTSARDVTNKRYVDGRKPLITIWAQEVGPLNNNQFEWSFGGEGTTPRRLGYCMPTSGRILSSSLSSIAESGTAGNAGALIVINGQPKLDNQLVRPGGYYSYTKTFTTPTELAKNDRINFRTFGNTANATNSIASLLIELDL